MDLSQARTIKGYDLIDQIGEGAYGAVFRARQQFVEREVAIKIILPQFANQPEFIRRFETEAQLVAQLEHLHIVPLYDYWRDPDGAYLVMRLMKGGSLAYSLRRNGTLQARDAVHMVDQVASALDAAHRKGVIHRDLKPANILLDEDGNAYLSDFGIAKAIGVQPGQTATGAIVGTPAYISPEQAQSLQVTPQTDIYALGVMLFEILTGEHPFPDTPTGGLLLKHINEPLPLVHVSHTELPPEIDNLIQKATAKDPGQRYPDAVTLAADFRRALRLEIEFPIIPEGELTNPFKGLRAFQESDAADFFGRAALTAQLVERLGEQAPHDSFLAVVGPSGSGKSSVVKAGLLPALRQGALPGSGDWFIVTMVPGHHPLEELEIALLRVATNPNLELSEQLHRDARGLLRASRLVLPDDDQHLLLVIDQFEEVFSLADEPGEASHFMDLVYQAVSNTDNRIRVVLTLRADFYDRPLMHPDLSTMMQSRTALVLPMTPQELSQAIRCPAEQAGVVLEESLATRIIADVVEQPGALPLLQYALTELFERREGRRLTAEAYQEVGGVLGALGKRAEQTYQALPADLQALTRQVFLRLVTLGEGVEDTRRRVLQSELEALTPDQHAEISYIPEDAAGRRSAKSGINEILDTFGRARLLSFDRDPLTRGPTVEVAHEALLREWTRLREWLDESRADIRSQRVLGNAATEWLQAEREPSFLLRGTRLDQFAAWAESTDLALTQSEQEYLQACLAERRARETAEAERLGHEAALEKRSRNILRILVGVLGMAAVIALVLSLYAFNQQSIARDSAATATIAQGQAQVEAATAVAAQQEAQIQADRADQAAVEAQAQREIAEQESRAAREAYSLSLAASAQQALDARDPVTALALALAANRIPDPPREAQRILLESAYAPGLRVPINSAETFGEQVYWYYLYPDGKTAISDVHGRKVWWDLDTQTILQEFPDRQDLWDRVYFSQDRFLVLSATSDDSMTLWDLVTGEDISSFQGHSDLVVSADISPDERFLVSSSNYEIILWDLETGDEIRRFEWFPPGESGTSFESSLVVSIVEFSSDSSTFVGQFEFSGEEVHHVVAWDVETGELINQILDIDVYTEVAVNPDHMLVLSGLRNGLVELRDLESGQVIHSLDEPDHAWGYVAISPDGTRALSCAYGGKVILWDLVNREAMVYFDRWGGYVPDISWDWRTALFGWGDGDLAVWDLVPAHQVRQFASYFSPVSALTVSPDGRYLLASGGSESRTADAGEDVFRLWDIERGELLRTFTGHTALVLDIDISPDGRLAASASADRTIKLWDLETGEELRTFLGHTDQVTGVAFSPDGKTLASSSRDRSLILWEIDTGEHKFIFTPDIEGLNDLDFSPDGQRLVSAGGSGISFWDAESGKLVSPKDAGTGTLAFPMTQLATNTVAFSPDGERLISTSKTNGLHLWDVGTGEEIGQYQGFEKITSAAISLDGRTALLGAENGLILLWDLQTGEVLRRFNGHNGHVVLEVAFSPDESSAFTTGEDGRIVQWSLDAPASLEELFEWIENNRYVREFTCTERVLYSVEPLCETEE